MARCETCGDSRVVAVGFRWVPCPDCGVGDHSDRDDEGNDRNDEVVGFGPSRCPVSGFPCNKSCSLCNPEIIIQ